MIDTKELRRLAQAATPGPWYARNGTYEGRNIHSVVSLTDSEGFTYPPVIATAEDNDTPLWAENISFIAAVNPAMLNELLDRLEAAEKSDAESIAMYRKARDERDALRTRIEAAEKEIAHIKEVEFPRKARAVAVGWEMKCIRLEQERTIDEQRIADLMAELNRVGQENEELRAKIEAMEKQEPVRTQSRSTSPPAQKEKEDAKTVQA